MPPVQIVVAENRRVAGLTVREDGANVGQHGRPVFHINWGYISYTEIVANEAHATDP
jgi:hypothetical protein